MRFVAATVVSSYAAAMVRACQIWYGDEDVKTVYLLYERLLEVERGCEGPNKTQQVMHD